MADLATNGRTDTPRPSFNTPIRISATVLRLRMHARAAGYNPDSPASLDALACVSGNDTDRLAAALTGRLELDWPTRKRLQRALGVADPGRDDVPALPPIPGPSAAQRTVASYERPDVRRVISALWNY